MAWLPPPSLGRPNEPVPGTGDGLTSLACGTWLGDFGTRPRNCLIYFAFAIFARIFS